MFCPGDVVTITPFANGGGLRTVAMFLHPRAPLRSDSVKQKIMAYLTSESTHVILLLAVVLNHKTFTPVRHDALVMCAGQIGWIGLGNQDDYHIRRIES